MPVPVVVPGESSVDAALTGRGLTLTVSVEERQILMSNLVSNKKQQRETASLENDPTRSVTLNLTNVCTQRCFKTRSMPALQKLQI